MIIISHRGNVNGPVANLENNPTQIQLVLAKYPKFYVEIDVWFSSDHTWWLGHDSPIFKVDFKFLKQSHLLLHAKNLPALIELNKHKELHYFFHNMDAATITSAGYLWCNQNVIATGGIAVTNLDVPTVQMVAKHIDQQIIGVCTDYPLDYYKIYASLT